MASAPPLDPRPSLPIAAEESVRPVVALPRRGVPTPVLVGLAVLAAILLFVVLDARRRAVTAPDMIARGTQPGTMPAAPPPLYVPPEPLPAPVTTVVTQIPQPVAIEAPRPRPQPAPRPAPQPQIVYVPQPNPQPVPFNPPQPRPAGSGGSALVIDTTTGPPAGASAEGISVSSGGGLGGGGLLGGRSRAGIFANRGWTVPQGTLIPAVLETAFNSTRPGLARAIVSQDVRGFDGKRVLIPRGSRLIGEYRADVQPGQNRALVTWSRLIRPDGVSINIGSPATDTLGRGGVKGNVNSHFFERFASALLQSTLDIGVNLASRVGTSGVVVLPTSSSAGALSALLPRTQIPPTITVPAGRSISVFVARDLDFTGVEGRQ